MCGTHLIPCPGAIAWALHPLLLTAIAPAAPTSAPGAQVAPLTLRTAVDTALAQNPQLRAATAELDANDGTVRQAG
jgi:cobalt-zinc-cadmium efflux system outer membrane protein